MFGFFKKIFGSSANFKALKENGAIIIDVGIQEFFIILIFHIYPF